MKAVKILLVATVMSMLTGCAAVGTILNPFYSQPSEVAYLGDKNDAALNDSGSGKADRARAALEAMATYQRAHAPQPNNPVMMPAVVRLMWVPDHLNAHGDLVPAHYYYLKVKKEQWAVTDAFELEAQLNGGGGNSAAAGFVNPEDLR
jgi:hypothetical protein